jgi:hypothetical protein
MERTVIPYHLASYIRLANQAESRDSFIMQIVRVLGLSLPRHPLSNHTRSCLLARLDRHGSFSHWCRMGRRIDR